MMRRDYQSNGHQPSKTFTCSLGAECIVLSKVPDILTCEASVRSNSSKKLITITASSHELLEQAISKFEETKKKIVKETIPGHVSPALIIGKGGETIKRLGMESKCVLQYDQEGECLVILPQTEDSLNQLRQQLQKIYSRVSTKRSPPSHLIVDERIPRDAKMKFGRTESASKKDVYQVQILDSEIEDLLATLSVGEDVIQQEHFEKLLNEFCETIKSVKDNKKILFAVRFGKLYAARISKEIITVGEFQKRESVFFETKINTEQIEWLRDLVEMDEPRKKSFYSFELNTTDPISTEIVKLSITSKSFEKDSPLLLRKVRGNKVNEWNVDVALPNQAHDIRLIMQSYQDQEPTDKHIEFVSNSSIKSNGRLEYPNSGIKVDHIRRKETTKYITKDEFMIEISDIISRSFQRGMSQSEQQHHEVEVEYKVLNRLLKAKEKNWEEIREAVKFLWKRVIEIHANLKDD